MSDSAAANEALSLLKQLIAIPSVNPDQVEHPDQELDVVGEARIVEFLRLKFESLGADEVIVDDQAPLWVNHAAHPTISRPNIYAVWRAADSENAKWVGIDTHVDTVSVKGMGPFGPFDGVVTEEDGKLHGRGSCDTKATLACACAVLAGLQAAGAAKGSLPVNLVICGTAGEETGRLGANGFRQWLTRRGIRLAECLVAEPTSMVPVYGHKGTVRVLLVAAQSIV
jgi:acetylornithine deacetylase